MSAKGGPLQLAAAKICTHNGDREKKLSDQTALTIAGIGIAIAVPATFMFANWVRKNVDHGEARFDSSGKLISDKEKYDDD